MATSFRKRAHSSKIHPLGTRPSIQNASLLLVSTGVPSMDALLGGGMSVGSIMLVEEDINESYSRVIFKYYIAEGVMCGHSLLLSSASEKPTDLLNDLPGPVQEDSNEVAANLMKDTIVEEDDGDSEEMKIAWRYQSLPKVKSSFSNKFGHRFDLTSKMEAERLDPVKISVAEFVDTRIRTSAAMYSTLLQSIRKELSHNIFSNSDPADSHNEQKTILRIAIQSIGSPLWLEDANSDSLALTQFLHSLRCLLHTANAVAMITIPTHLFQNPSYVRRVERLCDCVVRLESFAGSDKEHNPLFKEYHGLFHFVKLPTLKSLTCHYPETLDLAFKLKRKKFVIEKLHIPPELSDTVARPQEDDSQFKNKSIKSKRIDF
ncbi:PREDICTED: elongator complex protein 4-like [Amphimedon queenslandica]|uniref:Elongator complex protein 4 n=1 Tax=Amphimedon queenslandica TaxID=400682 RepID=A0A1X7VT92_AMPQE|nr:PREDICTED: elongator complex protein 4-like [Amphimedon queenslandica]|eukprot:XP_003383049.1 PREDICTED: elongator complex protein 4-like [Amphimedon queenslandica]